MPITSSAHPGTQYPCNANCNEPLLQGKSAAVMGAETVAVKCPLEVNISEPGAKLL